MKTDLSHQSLLVLVLVKAQPAPEVLRRMMARAVLRMLEELHQPAAVQMLVLLREHRMTVAQPVFRVQLQKPEVHLLELRMRYPQVLHRMPVALLALLARHRMLVALRERSALRRKMVAQALLLAQLRIPEVYRKRHLVPVVDRTVVPERFRTVLLHLLVVVSISLESEDPSGFRRHFEPLPVLVLPVPVPLLPNRMQLVPPVVPRLDLFFLSIFLELEHPSDCCQPLLPVPASASGLRDLELECPNDLATFRSRLDRPAMAVLRLKHYRLPPPVRRCSWSMYLFPSVLLRWTSCRVVLLLIYLPKVACPSRPGWRARPIRVRRSRPVLPAVLVPRCPSLHRSSRLVSLSNRH